MLFDITESDARAPKENRAIWLPEPEKLVFEQRDIPTTCGPWDAIICPKRTGICGSDMHVYLGHLGENKAFVPRSLGHECAGVIHKVGENVRGLEPGDRVALEPGQTCLRCHACKTGHYAHCVDIKFAAATGGADGTLQGYYMLPADLCYKLPDDLSLEEGALMEPLSVAVNAVSTIAQIRPASNVAIFGAGPVGLLTMAICKAFGARRIIAIDVNQARLDFARSYLGIGIETQLAIPLGPDEAREDYSKRHAAVIKEIFAIPEHGPGGIQYVFECSGAEVCAQTGLWLLQRRGRYIQIGNGALYQNLPLLTLTNRELSLLGSFRYGPGAYEMAIDLVSRGLVDLKPLVTHKFSFRDVQMEFETTKAGKGPDGKMAIKVIIEGPEA